MHTFFQDLQFSLRLLVKSPGFAAAAIGVLALGIGLNTAMFSVVHAFAFSARPFPAAEQVVQLYTQNEQDPAKFRAFSHAAYRSLRERSDIFSGVLAHTLSMVGVGEGAQTRRVFSALVSDNYFQVLGVPLLRGRPFTADEARPGANIPVVIASHLAWKKAGARSDYVGSTIRVNERIFTVIGVTPEGFTGTMMLAGPEFYFPLGVFDSLSNDFEGQARRSLEKADAYNLFLVARLAPAVTPQSLAPALTAAADQLEAQFPHEHLHQNIIAGPLPRLGTSTSPSDEGVLRTLSAVLLAMTGAVLLIVCLNLAGVLLARGHGRRKEFAIRIALGGGRFRIIRQLLTESLLLSFAGGALGLAAAAWSTDFMITALSNRMPIAIFFGGTIHIPVITATLLFCGVATLFFALGPALKLSRGDVITDLKGHAAEDVVSKRPRWWPRHPLVVLQIALSLTLLIGAGLFVRLAVKTVSLDSGYRADDTLIAELDAGLGGYDQARSLAAYRHVTERLSTLPGVQSASIGAIAPFGFINIFREVRRAGLTPPLEIKANTTVDSSGFNARWNAVGADYFATMNLPLVRGRAFTSLETDAPDAPAVVIIDEVLAKKLWPEGDALGQHIQWNEPDRNPQASTTGRTSIPRTWEIVGIAKATRDDFAQREAGNSLYVPFAQGFMSNVHFHVRPAIAGEAAALALIEPVRRELLSAAPGVPLLALRTFAQHRDASIELWGMRLAAVLFSIFGILAMFVAVIGLYGVKAYVVSRRTREIGIRLALGAEPRLVRNMILREGLAMTLLGIGLGGLLGAGLGRVLAGLFVDLPAFDAIVYGLAALSLIGTATLACWIPARRATRVNPLTALRTE